MATWSLIFERHFSEPVHQVSLGMLERHFGWQNDGLEEFIGACQEAARCGGGHAAAAQQSPSPASPRCWRHPGILC